MLYYIDLTRERYSMKQPSDMIVYDSSLRPSTQKSIIRKFADTLTMGMATEALRGVERQVGVGPVAAALHTIRANGEGGITGLGLGLISGMGGLDRQGVPVDLAGSGAAAGLGILFSASEFGITFRQVSASCMTVFSFRKTEEWMGVRKKATFAGEDDDDMSTDMGEDPIVAAAREL